MKRESDTTALQYILLLLLFVLIFFGPFALFLFSKPWNDIISLSLISVLYLFILVSTIRSLILLPKRRKGAGELILAARPLLTSIIFYFAVAIMFLFFGWLTLSQILNYPNYNYPMSRVELFFLPTMTFYWLVRAFQQVEFRERGICSGATFLAWDEMESFAWVGRSNTFSVRLRRPGRLRNSHSWEVGKQYTAEVQRLLMDRLFFRGVDERAAFQKDN